MPCQSCIPLLSLHARQGQKALLGMYSSIQPSDALVLQFKAVRWNLSESKQSLVLFLM